MIDCCDRAVELGLYIVNNSCTVRAAASHFGVSKSTVYTDVAKRLRRLDRALWLRVRAVLQRNKDERHLRGGYATREKYSGLRRGGKRKNAALLEQPAKQTSSKL